MTYKVINTKASGDTFPSSSEWNQVSENLEDGTGQYSTKGDMVVGGGLSASVLLPVGLNGSYLWADANRAGGLAWGRPGHVRAGGNLTVVNNNSIGPGTWEKSFEGSAFFGAAAIDAANAWNRSVDTYIVPHPGTYLVSVQAVVLPSASFRILDEVWWAAYVNGAINSIIAGGYPHKTGNPFYSFVSLGYDLIELNAGDVLEIYVYAYTSAGSINRFAYNQANKLIITPIVAY